MNELAFQLMSLQYELAMKIGGTLDRGDMLQSVLETLVRRLDARAAAVFEVADAQPRLVAALPGGWKPGAMHGDALTAQNATGAAPAACAERLGDGAFLYVFSLSDFGLLQLERDGDLLEPRVLRALEPLMAHLGCRLFLVFKKIYVHVPEKMDGLQEIPTSALFI
jgi:hypothetical protein